MALKMECPPAFQLNSWADVRLSTGDKGSFLFINNYQDDPIETTVEYKNEVLFAGHLVAISARRGLILPIEWQINSKVRLHYGTSEVMEIKEDESTITLKMDQNLFTAELTVSGYSCSKAIIINNLDKAQRVKINGKEGMIILRKE